MVNITIVKTSICLLCLIISHILCNDSSRLFFLKTRFFFQLVLALFHTNLCHLFAMLYNQPELQQSQLCNFQICIDLFFKYFSDYCTRCFAIPQHSLSIERQKSLTTFQLHIQLDPFAPQLTSTNSLEIIQKIPSTLVSSILHPVLLIKLLSFCVYLRYYEFNEAYNGAATLEKRARTKSVNCAQNFAIHSAPEFVICEAKGSNCASTWLVV